MALLDDTTDLVVDLLRDLVRVVGLGAHVAPEEGEVVVSPEDAGTELLGHPEAHDHLLRCRGHLLQVVGSARRHLVEDELLGRPPTERRRQLVHERRLRDQVLVLGRERDGEPERLAAGHDRDLVDRVRVLEVVPDGRVTHLVIGGDLALLL